MTKFVPLRSDISVQLHFQRPLLPFNEASHRFISMIYDRFGNRFNVSTRELSVSTPTVLSEAWVRYSLFGGNSSITLYSDRIVGTFSGLSQDDYDIVTETLALLHDGFYADFKEVVVTTLEYREYGHLQLVEQATSEPYMKSLEAPWLKERALGADLDIEAGVKFNFRVSSKSVDGSLQLERSLLSTQAVFVVIATFVRDLSALPNFAAKYELVNQVTRRCLRIVDLDPPPYR